jgi:hypothetical protein
MQHYAGLVPEALDDLPGEERHQINRIIRLRVTIRPDGDLDVEGVLREPVCTLTGTPSRTPQNTNRPEVRFRVRTNEEVPRLELAPI